MVFGLKQWGGQSIIYHTRGEHVYHYPSLINIDHTRFQGKITYSEGLILLRKGVRVMVFNATLNNISVISWWSVLFVEETGVPGENHRPAASRLQTWSHNVLSITSHNISGDRGEWVIVVWCQLSNLSAISWREQVNFQWDDDEFL